ncbi:UNVERIFIED_ORG: 5-(carboxyamino)imidazole ribonucleotide synthase [Xanthobacter viscosus]|jgi:5-(carboxyamino)imidazole ribonucleotide synthase|uniref:N5-carboxyaminoimidazole ribonucleotide synthase n=1 Tax=Xanthobacter autotrophicus TaxID=280 RepID=A0A6C1KJ98_XANAU|nr:5-(carboxyamino)imidazole ribonucleotide synthase [Xanthobacter autotrophicus]TLX43114.1 5-(carboxyamino)imidazole ribonucleotide synthase [Xanthobacter autotrophicus]
MLKPGSVIGILGGGQLGRMIALAAAELGLKTHILCPDKDSPAFHVSEHHICAPYDDFAALERFAAGVDVVTYEFENVPLATAEFLAARVPLRPGAKALAITQDRLAEKSFVRDLGIETAPFAAVDDLASLEAGVAALGLPAVLKTRRFGYDGKGQVIIRPEEDLTAAWHALGRQSAILEGFVAFEREVSVVAARRADGAFQAFDVTENVHREHILHTSTVPATLSAGAARQARSIARTIGDALDYEGVFAVELFVVGCGAAERVIVNEIAPRVHNSGHWTQDGAVTSQFEQHVRAIAGWPLGEVARVGRAQMTNLIGADVHDWHALLAEPGTHVHLYGKDEARAGRKMGHVVRVRRDPEACAHIPEDDC